MSSTLWVAFLSTLAMTLRCTGTTVRMMTVSSKQAEWKEPVSAFQYAHGVVGVPGLQT